MPIVEILPWIAALIFIFITWSVAFNRTDRRNNAWTIPALFCALFFAWSLGAVVGEGPLGFWPEHVRNMWGNQIWFDLLLAIGVAFFLIAPEAKRLGMSVPAWLVFITATGSIGLTAMLARFLFLKERARLQG